MFDEAKSARADFFFGLFLETPTWTISLGNSDLDLGSSIATGYWMLRYRYGALVYIGIPAFKIGYISLGSFYEQIILSRRSAEYPLQDRVVELS